MRWLRRGKSPAALVPPAIVAELRQAAVMPHPNPAIDVARRGRTLHCGIVVMYARYESGGRPVEHLALSHAGGRELRSRDVNAICRAFWPEGGWQEAPPTGMAPGTLNFARPLMKAVDLMPSFPAEVGEEFPRTVTKVG